MSIFFWQESQWEQATRLHKEGRLPHALLLSGIKGLGKVKFAQYFGQWLLCTSACKMHPPIPCEACQSCQWMKDKAHPEWLWIAPLEGTERISIDQIRDMLPWMQLTPHYASQKWIFIEAPESMTVAASHALLKMLEEPSSTTGFIVVSSHKTRLQPTILSRLTLLNFKPPLESDTQAFFKHLPLWALRMAKGAPLVACEYASDLFSQDRAQWVLDLKGVGEHTQDPIDVAQRWVKKKMNPALYLFYYWLIDLIYMVMKGPKGEASRVLNVDELPYLRHVAPAYSAHALLLLVEQLEKVLCMKNQVSAINNQLCFETLLIQYAQLKE